MTTETIERYERQGQPTLYRRRIEEDDGSFRSESATEHDWVGAELCRLDDIREDLSDEDDPDSRFADALDLAETLMCRLDDLRPLDGAPAALPLPDLDHPSTVAEHAALASAWASGERTLWNDYNGLSGTDRAWDRTLCEISDAAKAQAHAAAAMALAAVRSDDDAPDRRRAEEMRQIIVRLLGAPALQLDDQGVPTGVEIASGAGGGRIILGPNLGTLAASILQQEANLARFFPEEALDGP